MDPDGEPSGAEVELVEDFAAELGAETIYVRGTTPELLEAIRQMRSMSWSAVAPWTLKPQGTEGGRGHDGLPRHALRRRKAQRSDRIADAEVRLREEGQLYSGETFVVLSDSSDLT